ncbi:hypothetical protein EGI22_12485 [Lacihabitans sp. LS3-19]|uniref:lysyl oxidase family protein n=1 Tax=Lacihabitans sp. LS3-19 TaxID=2487335 RepID=UPI0020CC17FB|nr:lysyl oxidase family protein [Lacihabitans sp. LS3-19]MCP9768735.1 hypothetical protein [Lacihabitans sp. LS3-19]
MNIFKAVLSLALFLCFSKPLYSQEFNSYGGFIKDFPGVTVADTFKIKISGIKDTINSTFGIAKVCFTIAHSLTSDLKVELFAPDGTGIWLTNRNGNENGENYTFTCFKSNGFTGYIHEGSNPFSGEFIPDGRMEYLNNGQSPNGIWKLLITDLKSGDTGKLLNWSLFFNDNPNPNNASRPCGMENPDACKCHLDASNCTLLPDLVLLPEFTKNQIKEYQWNHYQYAGQLRLAASIANIGNGPMETFGKNEWFCGNSKVTGSIRCSDGSFSRQKLYQRIYKLENKNIIFEDVPAGTNYYDDKPGHNHYHVDSWISFKLYRPAKKSRKRKLMGEGEKVSYCLFDTGILQNDHLSVVDGVMYGDKNLPNYGFGYFPDCKPGVQGISVGGYDTYGMLYEGQYIDLPKKLKPGKYELEIEIDPDNKYRELNKENNVFSMLIDLNKQKGKR